jgi:pimeloyl-ACP methyl ester carboxylesterase
MSEIAFNEKRTLYFEWLHPRKYNGDPVIVLINGIFSDSRNYGELYAELIAKDIPTIAIDNTNLGRSTRTCQVISLQEQVDELEKVCLHESIAYPIWVANSSAAGIACLAAANLPTYALILGSPVLSCGIEGRLKLFRSVMAQTLHDKSLKFMCETICLLALGSDFLSKNPYFLMSLIMKVRSMYSHKDFLTVWEQTNGPEEDNRDTIQSINVPMLIIRGREEMLEPLHILESLFVQDNCHIKTLPIGHYLLNEARTETINLIAEFYYSLNDGLSA